MSSCGNNDSQGDSLMQKKTHFGRSTICIKCKTEPGKIIVRHAVYCKSCFFPMVLTKFRRCLDPHVNPKPDGPRRTKLKASGNLLIGFSGGVGSSIMLDTLAENYFQPVAVAGSAGANERGGKDHPRNVRAWKEALVCFVNTTSASALSDTQLTSIRSIATQYPQFKFLEVKLEDAFSKEWWLSLSRSADEDIPSRYIDPDLNISTSNISSSQDPKSQLSSYLSSLPTTTARFSAIQNLTRLLLLSTAWAMDCSHLLLGTNLTSFSVSLLSSISSGGGFNVPEEIFEEWSPQTELVANEKEEDGKEEEIKERRQTVRIIKPLREVGLKECAAWMWWKDISITPRMTQKVVKERNIQSLTRDFVYGLERDYPSTVSTITRTCAKLTVKGLAAYDCALCSRPVQPQASNWKASISKQTLNDALDLDENLTRSDTLTSHICYACSTDLTSRNAKSGVRKTDPTPLPVWAANVLSHRRNGAQTRQSDMKKAIQEFLL